MNPAPPPASLGFSVTVSDFVLNFQSFYSFGRLLEDMGHELTPELTLSIHYSRTTVVREPSPSPDTLAGKTRSLGIRVQGLEFRVHGHSTLPSRHGKTKRESLCVDGWHREAMSLWCAWRPRVLKTRFDSEV